MAYSDWDFDPEYDDWEDDWCDCDECLSKRDGEWVDPFDDDEEDTTDT